MAKWNKSEPPKDKSVTIWYKELSGAGNRYESIFWWDESRSLFVELSQDSQTLVVLYPEQFKILGWKNIRG